MGNKILKGRKVIKYISKKEALALTEEIFWEGWDKFIDYLYDHDLVEHMEILNETKLPELAWRKLDFKLCGVTTRRKGKYTIDFNINYLYSEDAYEFLRSTVLHELAHYLCDVLFDDFEHDDLFRKVCRIMGDSGETKGVYSSPTNEPIKNFVECKCGFCMNFSNKEFKKVISRLDECPRCGRTIKNLIY